MGRFQPGFMSGIEPPSIALVATDTQDNSDSYSATLSFGGLGKGQVRHIIITVTAGDLGTSDDTVSVAATIGGVSVTSLRTANEGGVGRTSLAWIGIAQVDSGISGTVTVTLSGFSGTMDKIGIALYRAVGLSSATPTATAEDVDGSLTMNVPSNGFGVIATAQTGANESMGAYSGTGLTEAFRTLYGNVAHRTASGSQSHSSSAADSIVYATWPFQ